MNDELVIGIILIALITMAGCVRVTEQPGHEIDYDGEVSLVEGVFRMEGQLEVDSGASADERYTSVRIVFYDNQKREIESFPVGTLSVNPDSGPTSQPVNISSDRIPDYVLVESPDFWESETNLLVVSFQRRDDQYEQFYRSEREDFSAE